MKSLFRNQQYKLIDTYKSVWVHHLPSNNYERRHKARYSFDFLERLIPKRVASLRLVRGAVALLGHKKQDVDYYRYYSEIVESGQRGKWENEWADFWEEVSAYGVDLNFRRILDISGEPGFFGLDAVEHGCSVLVTSFADNVAHAMKSSLGLDAVTYDFQGPALPKQVSGRQFDLVTVRYAIGFCEDLQKFLRGLRDILRPGGYVYVSFSPSSRAVCARWMFDDYTYLRQWDMNFLIAAFREEGFGEIARHNHGSYPWDKGMHPFAKFMARRYLPKIFEPEGPATESEQHNWSVMFKLGNISS